MFTAQEPPGQKPVGRGHVTPDVDEMEAAAGPQNAKYLARRRGFRCLIQVVPHHRGQDTVELVVTER